MPVSQAKGKNFCSNSLQPDEKLDLVTDVLLSHIHGSTVRGWGGALEWVVVVWCAGCGDDGYTIQKFLHPIHRSAPSVLK